jgi:rod shape-determining protein MreC
VETSSFFRVVRIRLDVGDAQVSPGMPVVASAGVVGRVQRVFGRYADVLLAADPKSSIDVVVPRTGGRGVVKGIPGDNRYRTRIEYLLRKDEVAEGDLVVTSGLGGTFPRHLPIGKIVKIARRDYGLYQEAEVEPLVDFGKLTEVLVMLAPPADADHSEAPVGAAAAGAPGGPR